MVNLQLDYKQVKELVDQLGKDEMDRLTEYLEKRKMKGRLQSIREMLKDIPLTMEEMNEEVKSVREELSREGCH